MAFIWLTMGLVIGGLFAFLIAKWKFKPRMEGVSIGSLMIDCSNPNKLPDMYLALDVDPGVVLESKLVTLKVRKHSSQK